MGKPFDGGVGGVGRFFFFFVGRVLCYPPRTFAAHFLN